MARDGVAMHAEKIGDLGNDKGFNDALWKFIRTMYELPENILPGQKNIPLMHQEAYEGAELAFSTAVTHMQEKYIENWQFSPWKAT
eukprot:scaffold101751_cov48-Prasinocladus_malaysianus.AAC.1